MTIRDVAQAAGVSPSTVSLVINGAEGVANDTAAVVRREIERLNYRPGRRGRPRKRAGEPTADKRSNRLALLAWKMPHARLHTPVYMAVVHGVEQAATRLGKTMVLRHVLPDQRIADSVIGSRVDGAIMFGQAAAGDGCLANLPCVQVMGSDFEPNASWDHITYNDHRVGRLAADYLVQHGHQRLAYIGNPPPGDISVHRGTSFLRYAEQAGCTVSNYFDDKLFIETDAYQRVDADRLGQIVDRLLAGESRPTGLFVHADALTQSLYPILIERGIRPGTDIQVVSCNNERILLNGLQPPPATVDIHAADVGAQAVEQLIRRLEHPDSPRFTLALEPKLIVPEGK